MTLRTGASALIEQLRGRRDEIEQVVLARVFAIAGQGAVASPDYTEGLRAAVSAAIDYGLAALENEDANRGAPVPAELLSQARRAARDRVHLDTILRRYLAGYALLDDFIFQEAESAGLPHGRLQEMLRIAAATLDRLVDAASAEYRAEREIQVRSRSQRLVEQVRMLLAGDITDETELEYPLEAWHVGLVLSGAPADEPLRRLAKAVDRRLLLVPSSSRTVWAWLGGRREFAGEEYQEILAFRWPEETLVAVGEAARERSGWCLSHQQATAAHSVIARSRANAPRPGRYGDVALLAAALQNETLRRSLHHLYIEPLSAERDGGVALRQTLRGYFAAQGNVTSISAALGVDRKTITRRLRLVEKRIGRSLPACAADLELALQLEELATA